MPVILVIYDIRDDTVRNTVAKRLTALGFIRVQKSAYVRRGTSGVARHVFRSLSRLIDTSTDKLLVIPVPERVYATSYAAGSKVVGDGRHVTILT